LSRMPLLRHISLVISCAYLCSRSWFSEFFFCLFFSPWQFIIYIFLLASLLPYLFFSVLLVKNLCMSLLIYEQRPVARYLFCSWPQFHCQARLKNSASAGSSCSIASSSILMLFPKGCSNQRR